MEEEKKGKGTKKIIICVGVGIVIILLIGIIVFLALKLNGNQNSINNNEVTSEKENQGIKTENNGTSQTRLLSFNQMDYTDDSLSDDQKEVAKFFDSDYFFIRSYEEVVRYTDILKNMNISCYAAVDSILSSDSESFEALCQWGKDYMAIYDEADENGNVIVTKPIIIKGKKPQKMVMQGDTLTLKGKLIGAETRNINGKSKYLPVIEIAEIGENSVNWYSEDTIRTVSKLIFGNDIKVRKPTEDEYRKMVESNSYIYNFDYAPYLVEFENQSNLNFQVFDIWSNLPYGAITYNALYNQGIEKGDFNKRLYITPDLQKYIVFDMSREDKRVYISVYNRELKKLWSKEISNASNITWDSTNESVVFVSDNDLYNINIETGENIFDPVFVGKKVNVTMIDNGFILLSEDSDDAVMVLDKNGNIKNKYDIKFDSSFEFNGTSIQKIDNKYAILYDFVKEDYWNYKSKYIIIDQDGNKLSESE